MNGVRRLVGERPTSALGIAAGTVALALLAGCGGDAKEAGSGTLTTGQYAPMTAHKIYVTGEATDPDQQSRGGEDASTIVRSLNGGRYELTVINTSRIGFINRFSWVPPPGTKVTAVLSNSKGDCRVSDGAIACTVALRPPRCTCTGTGGSVTIRFAGANIYGSHNGMTEGIINSILRVESMTPVPYIIPSKPEAEPSPFADLPLCKSGQASTVAAPCLKEGSG